MKVEQHQAAANQASPYSPKLFITITHPKTDAEVEY